MVAQPKVSRPLVIHGISGRNPLALSPKLLKKQVSTYKFQRLDSGGSVSDDSKSASSATSLEEGYSSSEGGGAAVAPRIKASSASAAQVRSKFMNKLGIAPQMPEGTTSNPVVKRRDLEEPSYEIELNDQGKATTTTNNAKSALFRFFTPQSSSVSSSEEEKENAADQESESDGNNTNQRRSVKFHDAVTVYPVPLHTAYSSRIRDTVWTSVSEMEENIARNCLEFSAEHWDAAQVVEDQDMILYHGELVHPVHFA